MPEGPEVARTADILNEDFKNKVIIGIWIGERAKHVRVDTIESGTKIMDVSSYGKRIIFNLVSPTGTHFKLCSFLGMTGHWGKETDINHLQIKFTFGELNEKMTASCSKRADKRGRKIKVYNVDGSTLCYSDDRHFGRNVVCHTDDQ